MWTAFKTSLVAAMIVLGVSVGRVLGEPGDQALTSRLADWARDHHLSVVVDTVHDLR